MPSAFTRVTNGDLQLEFKGERCIVTRKGDEYYNEASTVVGLPLWAIKQIHQWYENNKPPFPGPGSTDALQLHLMEQRLKAVEEKTTAYGGGGTYGAWLSTHEDRITILEERLDDV